MIRKTVKMFATEIEPAGGLPAGFATGGEASLMALRHVSVSTVDEAGLRSPEEQPARGEVLQNDEELLDDGSRALPDVFGADELALERELPAHDRVVAERTPQGDVGFCRDVLCER